MIYVLIKHITMIFIMTTSHYVIVISTDHPTKQRLFNNLINIQLSSMAIKVSVTSPKHERRLVELPTHRRFHFKKAVGVNGTYMYITIFGTSFLILMTDIKNTK